MKISFTIITINSDPVLEQVMKSIKSIADEIIVIDSGSTDGTIAIAKKYTTKIFERKFENDYATQKNYAISKATGDWIFSLDSDEVLSEELQNAIPLLIKDNSIEGFWFRRRNYISQKRYLKYGLFYPDWQLRLFKKRADYIYSGSVHEKISIPIRNTKQIPLDILHYQQRPKYVSFGNFINMLPYITIHAKELSMSQISNIHLFVNVFISFLAIFFSGFIRGKGFLDGWAGFRSHFLFAASISLANLKAYKLRIFKTV